MRKKFFMSGMLLTCSLSLLGCMEKSAYYQHDYYGHEPVYVHHDHPHYHYHYHEPHYHPQTYPPQNTGGFYGGTAPSRPSPGGFSGRSARPVRVEPLPKSSEALLPDDNYQSEHSSGGFSGGGAKVISR
jgi:hypothetical protein